MRHRLLFLAATTLLVTASLPQPQPEKKQPSLCANLGSTEIIGITSLGDKLAVATRTEAAIHQVTGFKQQCKKLQSVTFETQINERLTEFKLLNETTLFYCDASSCGRCFLQDKKCKTLLNFDVIIQASATAAPDVSRIFLRTANHANSSLFSFEDLSNESATLARSNDDRQLYGKHQVVYSFSARGYAYFIVSSHQVYEPISDDAQDREEKYHFVKIMRVCEKDRTEALESRIELHLQCGNIDKSMRTAVSAASYVDSERKIYISFGTSTNIDSVCTFSLDEVNEKIDKSWDMCQNVKLKTSQMCSQYSEEDMPEHCRIVQKSTKENTRLSRHVSCSKFAETEPFTFDNCRTHEYDKNSYRYAIIENYNALEGKQVAEINNGGRKYPKMYVDAYGGLFFTDQTKMIRAAALMNNSMPLFERSYVGSSIFSLAHLTDRSYMMVVDKQVLEYGMSCDELYRECDDLLRGGFNDPLGCFYCPFPLKDSNGVMNIKDVAQCPKLPLRKSCPPVIKKSYFDHHQPNDWIFGGTGLAQLVNNNTHIKVCGQHCRIAEDKGKDTELHCILASGVEDHTCEIGISMHLENYTNFPVELAFKDSSSNTPTAQANSDGVSSRTWKIVLGVVVVLLIVGIIIVILLCARKYLGMQARNQKSNGASGIPFETMNSYPRTPARNTYISTDPSNMPFAANVSPSHAPAYERLFSAIDSRLKIPSDHLILEKQIGKGHFGVVIKGNYIQPGGRTRAVACKLLTEQPSGAISEFINEGLMMDKFDHPRVMSLVGISFNEEQIPILVTDFMENGDLAKYIRDNTNKPTLRELLNFIHEIAQGMQYLHGNKFIHRDLAARNCMLDRNLQVKVGDFGLCRPASSQDEYMPLHFAREMPLRWMSPEALQNQFTMAGDVWSFGVVIWEVMTRGSLPYQNVQSFALSDYLNSGKRLSKPIYCPDLLYGVMMDCWAADPHHRPTFKELPDRIEDTIDFLSNQSRNEMNVEYEQCNSVRNSRAASSGGATPLTHHTLTQVHSIPAEDSPMPTPV